MSVKLKLMELHRTSWKHSIFYSPKCLNYRIFKEDFTLEKYFNILPDDLSKAFCHYHIIGCLLNGVDFFGHLGMTGYVNYVFITKLVMNIII